MVGDSSRPTHTVPRAELEAVSRALQYVEAPDGGQLQLIGDCKYALDTLREIDRPEVQEYKSANLDIWMSMHGNFTGGGHAGRLEGHYVPSHLVEHPGELAKWSGPKWWIIGNELVDQYAKWGAQLGAVSQEDVACQQLS